MGPRTKWPMGLGGNLKGGAGVDWSYLEVWGGTIHSGGELACHQGDPKLGHPKCHVQ